MSKQKAQTEEDKQLKKTKRRRRTSVVVGHTVDEQTGKRIPVKKYPSASSYAKLEDKKRDLRRVHGAGGPGAIADIMFADYARLWLEGKRGDVSENTLGTYTSQVNQYIVPHLGKKQARSILKTDIKVMLGRLTHLAKNTRNEVIARTKAIFNQMMDDNIRSDNPARSIKRAADVEQKRRALTEKEEKAVQTFIAAHPAADEAKSLSLLFYTGMRKGESYGPQWKHIDFENRKIVVRQQLRYRPGEGTEISPKLKSKYAYREIPMPEQLYKILNPLRGLPDVYVFQRDGGEPYKVADVNALWASIKKGCPELAGLSMHYFRHNYATRLYKAGVPVKEAATYLGDTVEEMLKTYAHIEHNLKLSPDSAAYKIFSDVAKS
jgi:integrase